MLRHLLSIIALLLVFQQSTHGYTDTDDGIHFALVFDTPILMDWLNSKSINSMPYDFVWGASDALVGMYKSTNPRIQLSKYIPWARDPDNKPLAWWQANHPDWIVYGCDKKTPAGLEEQLDSHVSLDISNPDVIDWQISNYAEPASKMGFSYMAADNFAFGNAVGACGVYKNGQWVQYYNGQWGDPQYTAHALNWLKVFYTKVHALQNPLKLGVNFVIMGQDPLIAPVNEFVDHVDLVMDEAGFTLWGEGRCDYAGWANILNFIEVLETNGKSYIGIHQSQLLSSSDKEWAFAGYLMGKTSANGAVVTTIQGYGITTFMPDYAKLNVGTPNNARYLQQGVYWRDYSSGLCIVNPFKTSYDITINKGATYVDVQGRVYQPGIKVTLGPQSGLVLGVVGRTLNDQQLAVKYAPQVTPTLSPATPTPTLAPTTSSPTTSPTNSGTSAPTTSAPTTSSPTSAPTTSTPTTSTPTTTPAPSTSATNPPTPGSTSGSEPGSTSTSGGSVSPTSSTSGSQPSEPTTSSSTRIFANISITLLSALIFAVVLL